MYCLPVFVGWKSALQIDSHVTFFPIDCRKSSSLHVLRAINDFEREREFPVLSQVYLLLSLPQIIPVGKNERPKCLPAFEVYVIIGKPLLSLFLSQSLIIPFLLSHPISDSPTAMRCCCSVTKFRWQIAWMNLMNAWILKLWDVFFSTYVDFEYDTMIFWKFHSVQSYAILNSMQGVVARSLWLWRQSHSLSSRWGRPSALPNPRVEVFFLIGIFVDSYCMYLLESNLVNCINCIDMQEMACEANTRYRAMSCDHKFIKSQHLKCVFT